MCGQVSDKKMKVRVLNCEVFMAAITYSYTSPFPCPCYMFLTTIKVHLKCRRSGQPEILFLVNLLSFVHPPCTIDNCTVGCIKFFFCCEFQKDEYGVCLPRVLEEEKFFFFFEPPPILCWLFEVRRL